MPKGKKHTPERIIGILRRVSSGEAIQAVCREVNISEATLHRWKQQYGGMQLDELKELKALREENARLKRVVADQALNIQEPPTWGGRCGRRSGGPDRYPWRSLASAL